ncbi:MAG TPA: RIP metalloprotease RseP, partial [Gemmatimonadales bacterium]
SPEARHRAAGALIAYLPPRIGVVVPGLPAYRAGLKPGDLVVRAGGDTVRSWVALVRTIRASPGRSLELVIQRDGALIPVTVVPEVHRDSSVQAAEYGQIGTDYNAPVSHERVSLGTAVLEGGSYTWGAIRAVLGGLGQLVLGRVSLRQSLAGPIEIASVSGQVARLGIDRFLDLLGFFSINLAVLNLLPIPVLDGGQLVFLLAEGVRRRPLSLELRLRLTQVGFVFLLGLMSLAVVNGIFKFFGH